MSTRFSFEYEFTDDIAIRATPLGGLNVKFLRASAAMLLCLLASASVFAIHNVLEMPRGLLDGIPVALMALFGGTLVLMTFLHILALVALRLTRQQLRNWAGSLRGRKIRWAFSDDAFSVHASDCVRQMPWGDVRRLRTGAEFWTLDIKNGPNLLLPVEHLSNEIRELIRARTAGLAKAGGSK